MFLKLESWKKACIFKGVSIFEGVLKVGVLEEELVSSKQLQSSRVFLKLESWKKACIFKGASIFEGDRLQELRSLLSLSRFSFRPSRVKNFPLTKKDYLQEFLGGLMDLSLVWSMNHIHGLNYMDLDDERLSRCNLEDDDRMRHRILKDEDHMRRRILEDDDRMRRYILEDDDRLHHRILEDNSPSVIKLLLGDDQAFAIRSTTLVGAIGCLRRLER
ncbi:hypothetical protein E5676_scaffold482G00670 [Cucumis melo var. makuwa]|uniref:Uncharacterized protein n=1 Tax=Cucumis melo var. makuwa TaxID=1194695 RepID=A0A5A7SSB5_CUCMM|nr:hypothetical protein E6C27_scaffold269G00090 [Cucumis melo var. makuwa]TYK22026.1 hypothetical protein E5676_scaffold482G00670 [Cucumis melo var. makuwa]